MSETVISTLPTHQEEENGDLIAGGQTSLFRLFTNY